MKLNPIGAEVLQANLAQALAISELLLSSDEGQDNDLLCDWRTEIERVYFLLDDVRGVLNLDWLLGCSTILKIV